MRNKTILTTMVLLFIGISLLFNLKHSQIHNKFTSLNDKHYRQITQRATQATLALIKDLPRKNGANYPNYVIQIAEKHFVNTPYSEHFTQGEGNWCPKHFEQHHCAHIQQDPLYRVDYFNCVTYIQQVLALLQAHTLKQYEQNFLSIAYGAANQPPSAIHYYNRNNFISSDFNRINEKSGLLSDGLDIAALQPYVKTVTTTIDHNAWFAQKGRGDNAQKTVRVLHDKDGPAMLARLRGYPKAFHSFSPQKITMAYLPKETLMQFKVVNQHREYLPNRTVFNDLPTPSVLEVVRNNRLWKIKHKPISQVIHSGIAVSHVGLLYRAHYRFQQKIYPRIACQYQHKKKTCRVTTVRCNQLAGCNKLMFSHATLAYPNGYYFFQDAQHHYHCQAQKPEQASSKITRCNRVVSLPLQDYLAMQQYGQYRFMGVSSILGIHLETVHARALYKQYH